MKSCFQLNLRHYAPGTGDVSAWRMLRGDEAEQIADQIAVAEDKIVIAASAAAADVVAPAPRFHRLQGKVTAYKAGVESSALFETELPMEKGGAVLR